jgi:hypothetical protein
MSGPEFEFNDLHVMEIVEEEGKTYQQALTPPVCDFCMDRRVKWEYDCGTFVLVDGEFGSDDGWLACDRCSTLIEADKRLMLAERSLESWRVRGMPAVASILEGIRGMQAGFFEHRQGERQAFG